MSPKTRMSTNNNGLALILMGGFVFLALTTINFVPLASAAPNDKQGFEPMAACSCTWTLTSPPSMAQSRTENCTSSTGSCSSCSGSIPNFGTGTYNNDCDGKATNCTVYSSFGNLSGKCDYSKGKCCNFNQTMPTMTLAGQMCNCQQTTI